jgi:hypothetical protein
MVGRQLLPPAARGLRRPGRRHADSVMNSRRLMSFIQPDLDTVAYRIEQLCNAAKADARVPTWVKGGPANHVDGAVGLPRQPDSLANGGRAGFVVHIVDLYTTLARASVERRFQRIGPLTVGAVGFFPRQT